MPRKLHINDGYGEGYDIDVDEYTSNSDVVKHLEEDYDEDKYCYIMTGARRVCGFYLRETKDFDNVTWELK